MSFGLRMFEAATATAKAFCVMTANPNQPIKRSPPGTPLRSALQNGGTERGGTAGAGYEAP